MVAGCGDFQYATRVGLAFYFGEIGMRLRNCCAFRAGLRRQWFLSREMSEHLQQRIRRIHYRLPHQRRLRRALSREDECPAIAVRLQRHRECTANRPQIAGQRKLTGELEFAQSMPLQLSGRNQQVRSESVPMVRSAAIADVEFVHQIPLTGKT